MMRFKRIVSGLAVLSMLACNFVTQMVFRPTATPVPTSTPTATASLTPTPTPLVPAFIPPECTNNTPLATVPPEVALAQPTEASQIVEITQTEQLRILRDLEEIVEEVYVYPDFNGLDWEALKTKYRDKIEAGMDTETFYVEMQAMITELNDEHSFFLSPVEARQSETELRGENEFVGVGIYGQPDFQNERFIVISTFPGSPAEYAGIQAHDSILLIDGRPVRDDGTGNPLRGPQCSAVVLTVQSPGEASREVMLARQLIEGGLAIDHRLVSTTDGSKIGYIFIPTFFDETIPPQIENALNEFGPLDGLILDVRLNGGGSSNVVDPILAYFASGRLGQFVSRRSSRPMTVDPDPVQNSQNVPLVVIVSEDTVSFGEVFAGVLKDSGRAKIVGQTSLGNVEVLHGYDFQDGSQVWIAAEKFHSAFSDIDWEETGIIPDVQAFQAWETFYFETDPSVMAAVTLLGHQ